MINERGYRLNVGLVVINDKGKIITVQESINSWQFLKVV